MSCRGVDSVCTSDEAREYFKSKGLSYGDIKDADIYNLCAMICEEYDKSNKIGETSVNTIRLSKKIRINRNENGDLINFFLFVDSHYFKERECISFNRDGFIGFAGWADIGNLNPIKRAFLKWCDKISERTQRNGAE